MERPRFRKEVTMARKTFFGDRSQMKNSQWSTLPQAPAGCESWPTASSAPSLGKSCSLPALGPLGESRPRVASKSEIMARHWAGLAATKPVPDRSSWMHPRWGAGATAFGAPPLQKLSGRLLHARIAHLEGGVAKARREAEMLASEALEQTSEYRGFVLAEQRNLEEELFQYLEERERRHQLQAQGLVNRPSKKVRCVPVSPLGSSPKSSQKVTVRLLHSASENSLVPPFPNY